MVNQILRLNLERQIVFMLGIAAKHASAAHSAGAAEAATAASKASAPEPSSARPSATAATASIAGSLILIGLSALLVLVVICGLATEIIWRRPEPEDLLNAQVYIYTARPLAKVARNYYIARFGIRIEYTIRSDYRAGVAGVCKRRPITEDCIPIIIATGGDIKRAARTHLYVRRQAKTQGQGIITAYEEVMPYIQT